MQTFASVQVQRWLLVGVALVAALWFLYAAQTALLPFVLGLVLAYVLLPLVNLLEGALPWPRDRSLRRSLAVLLIYLAGLSALALAVAYLVPALAQQVSQFLDRLPIYAQRIQANLEEWTIQYRTMVPEDVQAWVDQQIQAGIASLQGVGQGLLLNLVRMVSATIGTVLGLFIIPIWLFFVLKDQPRAMPAFYGIFPPSVRPAVRDTVFIVDYILGRYIRTQLLLGGMVGLATFVGLTAIGVPFAPVLAVIGGFGELIPIIGPILGAIPAILVALATDPSHLIPVLILYWGIQFLENNLLVPRMQGAAVQLPPPIIMMLLVGAGEAVGIWGMLAAVPLAAILRDVFVYFYRRAGGHLPPTATEVALAAYLATHTRGERAAPEALAPAVVGKGREEEHERPEGVVGQP
ncbi:MAG: AI-2E family transporter [Chloroflexi bacterium]|nr:AI-2E family transporter [Chloroflexota bacterium]